MTRPRAPLLAAEHVVSRWTRFLRDVQDLTLEGTIEPRKWIGCVERFWIGMAEDAGDWLHVLAAEDESSAGSRRHAMPTTGVLPAGDRVLEMMIEVPREAFELLESTDLTLRSSPLQCGDDIVVFPGRNVRFCPPRVSSADRFAKLRLFDLPTLHAGMELRGVVWAEPPPGGERTVRGALPVSDLRILVT